MRSCEKENQGKFVSNDACREWKKGGVYAMQLADLLLAKEVDWVSKANRDLLTW